MIVDAIVTFFAAILSGLGVGSGGLLVLWLGAVRKMPQLQAQGINLAFFLVASFTALLRYIKRKKVLVKRAAWLSLFGVIGSFFGAWVAHLLPVTTLRVWFAWFLILTGGWVLVRNRKK